MHSVFITLFPSVRATPALACALLVGLCFGEPLDATVNRVTETQQEPTEPQNIEALRPAAEQGNVGAQYSLGLRYLNGEGVLQDHAEAASWFRLAADQGHAGAQSNLGVMYQHGRGVQQDDGEAARWYRLAADQGDASAQFHLGQMYGFALRNDDG